MYTYSLNKLIMCYEYLRLRFRVDQLPVKSPPTHIYTYSYFFIRNNLQKSRPYLRKEKQKVHTFAEPKIIVQ